MKNPGPLHIALVALIVLCVVFTLSGAVRTHVLIVHTNDIHGHILPDDSAGGLAMTATIVKQLRPDLLLDGGDMFTGTLLSDTFYGEPTIAAMNRMRYSVGILGNHEFDYGLNRLKTRMRQAKFPLLSANVTVPFAGIGKSRVIRARGIRFGIIGLTTEETRVTTHPKNVKEVQIIDVARALEQTLPGLRKASDMIVVLGHLSPEEELRIADTFPEIRLIISGHTHRELREPIRRKNATIVRTGSFGRLVGSIDLDFDGSELKAMSPKLIDVKGVMPDPGVLNAIEPFRKKVQKQMDTVVGEATAVMTRVVEDGGSLANLVADAYRARAGTQIAMANTGGIRTALPAGRITYGKIFEILPFENTLVSMELTGAQLKRSLAVDITAVSGVRVTFDLTRPHGDRLVSATLEDGSPIIDTAFYSVAVNDFMQAGGDGYDELAKGRNVKDTGERLRDVVTDYIRSKQVVSPVIDGRVQVIR